MKLKVLAVVLLAAVGVGAAFVALGGIPTSAASTTRFLTAAAATGNVTSDIAATGSVAAQAEYALAFGSAATLASGSSSSSSSSGSGGSSATTWPVKEVKVKVGDTVTKGEVLAVADAADLERQLTSATLAYDSAVINRRMAATSLSDARTADVTAQIRQAEIGYNNATSQLADASKTVTDLKAQIALATLKAPIDGVVTAVSIAAGFDAPSGAAITIDSTGFQITTDVVESDLANVKLGQAASVTVSAVGATVDGTVTAISPVAGTTSGNSSVVSFPVTVSLANVPATVKSGMSADVTITIASAANVLTVPAAALRGSTGSYTVLLMGTDGTPTAQQVDVGLVTNTLAEIKSGLTAGQEVVTGTSSPATTTTTTTGGFGGGVGIPGGLGGGGNFGGGGRRTTGGGGNGGG